VELVELLAMAVVMVVLVVVVELMGQPIGLVVQELRVKEEMVALLVTPVVFLSLQVAVVALAQLAQMAQLGRVVTVAQETLHLLLDHL
jgi:hypothetical protein